MAVSEDYEPIFQEAVKLDDTTVATVREVLTKTSSRHMLHPDIAVEILNKTQENLETIMGVSSAMAPGDFLTTVIRDYNALKFNGDTERG